MPDSPFATLGLAPTFDLDAAALRRAYLARSALLHPDLAAGDADAPRQMAALNQAKRILEDPEKRANMLLEIRGGPGSSQDRRLPDGFLAQIMESREAIEEAIASGGAEERSKWQAWADQQRAAAVHEVGAMFRALPTPPDAASLAAIRMRLNAWRYVERLIEQLDPGYNPGVADFKD